MTRDPSRLGRFFDYLGDHLEIRHWLGLPVAVSSMIIVCSSHVDSGLRLFFGAILATYLMPRRWIWVAFFGWAAFFFMVGLQNWKTLGTSIVLVVCAAFLFGVGILRLRESLLRGRLS